MKNIAKRILLKPPYVKWCSQTIYQSLLGCIKIYEFTKDPIWEERAKNVFEILCKIQQPDGGYDIGYNFNFGLLHKKGESTSPEMIGLLAMIEYGRVFGFSDIIRKKCDNSVSWIKRFSVILKNGNVYIPYAPYSTSDVMVYNGTSFVCGALGYYLGIFKEIDKELVILYNGMLKYLNENLIRNENCNGRYWPYYDQERTDIVMPQKGKVDNYHQMQQVEMHSYAQSVAPNEDQISIIRDASLYVIDIFKKEKIVPYTNNPRDFGGTIHLWGFSSILPGLIMANRVLPEELNNSGELIQSVIDFVLDFAWSGECFSAEVTRGGKRVAGYYMVRSDAWVFNSLAAWLLTIKSDYRKDEVLTVLNICYAKMATANFSGLESHASSFKTRLVGNIVNSLR